MAPERSRMPGSLQYEHILSRCKACPYLHPFLHLQNGTAFPNQNPCHSEPVFASASAEKGPLMGGVSAAVGKTSAAPFERVKMLIQNQDEMIKQGWLAEPYKGVAEFFKRTVAEESFNALWRGNLANVIRYFPTQLWTLVSESGTTTNRIVNEQAFATPDKVAEMVVMVRVLSLVETDCTPEEAARIHITQLSDLETFLMASGSNLSFGSGVAV